MNHMLVCTINWNHHYWKNINKLNGNKSMMQCWKKLVILKKMGEICWIHHLYNLKLLMIIKRDKLIVFINGNKRYWILLVSLRKNWKSILPREMQKVYSLIPVLLDTVWRNSIRNMCKHCNNLLSCWLVWTCPYAYLPLTSTPLIIWFKLIS